MERIDKIKLAIENGFTYNPETGDIFNKFGKIIKNKSDQGYIRIVLYDNNKKLYQLRGHQFAYYIVYGKIVEQIDHINGIRDDNRISNLRSVTNQQNQFNNTKSKGYSFDKKNNKWRAQIYLNNKKINLGLFNSEDDAREAYLTAKKQYHII